MSKKSVTVFHRDSEGHYILGTKRVGLDRIRAYIKQGKPFKVKSLSSGKDITHVAHARALAYRYISEKKRGVAGIMKKSVKLLTA